MGKNQSLNLPYPLILASTSKYRSALLSQLGLPFSAINPEIDENLYKCDKINPNELAANLSRIKAEAVFKKMPQCCVIGSDQVCTINDEILSKPGNFENAFFQIEKLQGKSHQLITAVTVFSPKGQLQFVNKTILHMRKLNEEQIQDYLVADSPFDCAGSYKLESRGIKLFERIEMNDHTSIIGLPLIELTDTLLSLGFPL